MTVITNEEVQAARIVKIAEELRAHLKEFFSHVSPITRPIPYENPVHFEVDKERADLRKKVLEAVPLFIPEIWDKEVEGKEYTEFVWYHHTLEQPTTPGLPYARCYMVEVDGNKTLYRTLYRAFAAAEEGIPDPYIEPESKTVYRIYSKSQGKLNRTVTVYRLEK